MFTKMFRIFAHVMHSHFRHIKELGFVDQVNMNLKYFVCFVLEFELVSTKELEVMRDWILAELGS